MVQKSIPESDHRGQQNAPVVSAASPLPWRDVNGWSAIADKNGVFVAHVTQGQSGHASRSTKANAALIVRAVNSHEALVKALAWALPLAEIAVNAHRLERIRCGHQDIRGKNKSGEIIGLYQSEIDEGEFARAALASAREVQP